MKALILAAGLGTRLRPLTEKTPKALVLIAGKPLLQYHLEHLYSCGVREVLINSHYLPEQVKEFINTYSLSHPEIKISLTYEPKLLGSAGTLKMNEVFFEKEEDFIVVYGDNLTNINYEKLISDHKASHGMVTIACYWEPAPETKGIVDFDSNHRILRFVEKPKLSEITTNYANAGIYVFKSEIFTHLVEESDNPYDFGLHVFPQLLCSEKSLNVYVMDEFLLDIGTLESYNKAEQQIRNLFL